MATKVNMSADTTDAEPDASPVHGAAVPMIPGSEQSSPGHEPAESGDPDSGVVAGLTLERLSLGSDIKYSMGYAERGHLVLMCNTNFDPSLKLPDRKGTDKDIEAVKRVFETVLGFTIEVQHNLTTTKMFQLLTNNCSSGVYKQCSCFALVLLTHGKDEGKLYGTDTDIKLDKLLEPVKLCEDLVGKPKMAFIQACRGKEYDRGQQMAADNGYLMATDDGGGTGEGRTVTIPVEADFLYVHSTVDGYVSFQNPQRGSWFIQTLCKEFETNHSELDVPSMITRVCRALAYDFASYTPSNATTHNLKQVCPMTSTLTKILQF